jgi:hypothetical protein
MPSPNKRVRFNFDNINGSSVKYTVNTSQTFFQNKNVYNPNKIYSKNDSKTYVRN